MMKNIILVALFVVYCVAAPLTSTEINTVLSLHNNARATAVPTPQTPLNPLVWDSALAAETQAWVNQCKNAYSQKYYGTVYGENPLIQKPTYNINSAFNAWFSQGSSFNFNTKSCSAQSCANYIQIVASTATSIGCAYNACSFGTLFVCNYKSFAQYTGVNPYIPMSGTTPTSAPQNPTTAPTSAPTTKPTSAPTSKPTSAPTNKPSTTGSVTGGSTTGNAATAAPTTSPNGYASIDYRGTLMVLGVHDQKQCGSCWAFSTTTIIEGALGKRGLTLPLLSDQNVLDCSNGGSCDGGWTGTALAGMIKKAGINSQAAYPYTQAQGTCAYNSAINQGGITKYGQTKGDFASIYNALKTYGPVGIAVYADNSWYSYKSGVFASTYTSVNHAVTVVGYDATKNAWIIKNSWGGSWGMSGYMYLSATSPAGANINGAFWAL